MKLLCFAVVLWSAVAAHAFDLNPDEADPAVPGLLRRRDPERRNRVFTSIFKVDNVQFQNVTGVLLKEGENMFVMPRRQRGNRVKPEMNKADKPEPLQYMKLIYNTTQPNQISMEYGVVSKVNLSFFVDDEDPEDF